MNWKYRGITITLDDGGVFYANVNDERLSASSLGALKKKIATKQDGQRKFDVPCWVVEVSGLEDRGDVHEIRVGRATFTGYNLVGGHPKLSFIDKKDDDRDVRVDDYNVMLWAFPIAKPGQLEPPLAVQQLGNAVAEYFKASKVFSENLYKLRDSRLPEYVSRGATGIATEAQVAERLGGT